MPRYYFHLVDDQRLEIDPDGTELPDAGAAKKHATAVAREFMRHCAPGRRHWKLLVRDSAGGPICNVLFATADRSIDHLDPPLRRLVERLSDNMATLAETISDSRMTILKSRAILARIERRPHLVAVHGRRI